MLRNDLYFSSNVISGPYFPVFGLNKYLSVFIPNTGKYGPEITLYLDTFHAVDGKWSAYIHKNLYSKILQGHGKSILVLLIC